MKFLIVRPDLVFLHKTDRLPEPDAVSGRGKREELGQKNGVRSNIPTFAGAGGHAGAGGQVYFAIFCNISPAKSGSSIGNGGQV